MSMMLAGRYASRAMSKKIRGPDLFQYLSRFPVFDKWIIRYDYELLMNRPMADFQGLDLLPADYFDRSEFLHLFVPSRHHGGFLFDILLSRLGNFSKNERFFALVHTYDLHSECEYWVNSPYFGSTPSDLYDNHLFYLDRMCGNLWEELDRRGLLENTMVIFTGDHGVEFFEHGRLYSGFGLYEESIRIPLILYIPGTVPRKIEAPASLIDIAPSLLRLLGISLEKTDFDGEDLAPLMLACSLPHPARKPIFLIGGFEDHFGVIDGNQKLIYNRTDNTVEM